MAEVYRPLVPTQVSDFPVHSVSKQSKTTKVKCFDAQRPGEISNLFTGIACVAGEIIVCDHENKNVKRFKINGNFVDCLPLTDPTGISEIPGSNDVIVTEPDIKQLTFCSLDGATKVSSISRTAKKYECVRAIDELKLIVGCSELGSSSVDIIDPNGNVLRSIQNESNGQTLFRNPAAISCLKTGEILISDPGCSLLICISTDGKTLFKYDPEGRPSGICVDQLGGIYMAQYDANTVYRLSSEGKKVSVIGNEDMNIKAPLALTISNDGNYLAMTEDMPSERILIIKLPPSPERQSTGLSLANVMVGVISSQSQRS